jgi:hypothetical protein
VWRNDGDPVLPKPVADMVRFSYNLDADGNPINIKADVLCKGIQ